MHRRISHKAVVSKKKKQPPKAAPVPAQPPSPEIMSKVVHVFSYIIALFAITQILGMYVGNFIMHDAVQNEVVQELRLVSEPNEPANILYLIFYVLLGALIMYLMIRFYRGELLFMLLEFAVISFASSIVFYSFIRPLLPDTMFSMTLAIVLGLAFGLLKAAFPLLRNAAAVIATAGAGAVFGFSLTFYPALVFLILLSIYDYIAVFTTGHMVEMAQTISRKKMSFMVSSTEKTERGDISVELGTGDMIMPIVLEVSGMQISPVYALVVFAASIFSLFVLFILLTKKKAVLPALPIIAVCNLVFLGISKLLGII